MVFMGGNSLLVSVNRSMREGFRDYLTADGVILSPTEEPMSLFGASAPSLGDFYTLPTLKHRHEMESLIEGRGMVSTPLISGSALMEASGFSRGIPFFGIDPESYFSLFPEAEMTGGQRDFSGSGALVSQALAEEWEKETGTPLRPGDFVKFSTLGDIGFTIRLVPVAGIYRFPYAHPLIDSLVLLDGKTARDLVRVLADQTKDTSPEEASDLFDRDLDDLFSEDFAAADGEEGEDILSSLDALFDEPLPDPPSDPLEGSWHFLLVRFARPGQYGRQLGELEALVSDYPSQVLNWRQAAGTTAGYAHFIQLFFYGGFALILLAGVLGIVNIMLISLFQRTVEIGTIQALGGTFGFIRRLLGLEYFSLSLAGGALSLIMSRILFLFLNSREIVLRNSLLNLVFGGRALFFPFTPGLAGVTLILCLLTGWVSSLYPIGKALALPPVDALKGGNLE